MFEMGAIKMLRGATINPGWFGHPATTTMYGLALVNILVCSCSKLLGWFPDVKSFGDAAFDGSLRIRHPADVESSVVSKCPTRSTKAAKVWPRSGRQPGSA